MNSKEHYTDSDGFSFPCKPYDVQSGFMKALYNVLQNSNFGIFESPTGTGKSLSIICGALKWLTDFQSERKENLQNQLLNKVDDSTTDDWFSNYAQKKERNEQSIVAKEELEFIEKRLSRIASAKQALKEKTKEEKTKYGFEHSAKRLKLQESEKNHVSDENEDFLIEDYDADNDVSTCCEDKSLELIKIFYASRTHSQLLQFVNELKKTTYSKDVTVTCLGSRAALCVNEGVKNLNSVNLINEKCFELLNVKSKSKENKSVKTSKCAFYKKSKIEMMQDHILAEPLDIEDLATVGTKINACPYFATRAVISDVELVVLPYNILFHKPTRESYGIKLKDNVIIIDEAHNLLDAINNMYSPKIHGEILQESQNHLRKYYERYRSRFSAKTVHFINLLFQLLDGALKYLFLKKSDGNIAVISTDQFLCAAKIDHVNIFDVIRFCEESHIGSKLRMFSSKKGEDSSQVKPYITSSTKSVLEKTEGETTANKYPSAFMSFIEFIKVFTLPADCGKIVCCKTVDAESSYYQFLHMNPTIHFSDIVSEARSVVLAGGTMSPISEFVDLLLVPSGASKDKICHYSFNHVVPEDNVHVMSIHSGLKNTTFNFKFESRQQDHTLHALGDLLVRVVRETPGGLVCFFPSYNYEKLVYAFMYKNGYIEKIGNHKMLFREPKQSNLAEELLLNYAKAIRCRKGRSGGAVLFSVVGGKMSEGINFSDDLCRCVVMVGMPYAKKDAIYSEKLEYLRTKFKQSMDNYTQMCMKAVNQSIGRAIRHKNDYAVIMLVDYRYCNADVLTYLPSWLSKASRFTADEAVSMLSVFFSKFQSG